ncbi:hypothetical protein FRC12_017978 [Ceratobasidium sp. 428]|nr:hypothetical protein FRC12_017978 [Ceratobasidium sp. 428]
MFQTSFVELLWVLCLPLLALALESGTYLIEQPSKTSTYLTLTGQYKYRSQSDDLPLPELGGLPCQLTHYYSRGQQEWSVRAYPDGTVTLLNWSQNRFAGLDVPEDPKERDTVVAAMEPVRFFLEDAGEYRYHLIVKSSKGEQLRMGVNTHYNTGWTQAVLKRASDPELIPWTFRGHAPVVDRSGGRPPLEKSDRGNTGQQVIE